MTLHKLEFVPVFASSSDKEFHYSKLGDFSSELIGWQSCHFCPYPQVLILRLSGGKQRVQKLQILSHHVLIPSRVDISVGNFIRSTLTSNTNHPTKDQQSFWNQVYFDRIGYVTMDSNQKTHYKSRELKSVHLDVVCEFIHLQFDACHFNSYNHYNQVGLVAVNLMGQQSTSFTPLHPDFTPEYLSTGAGPLSLSVLETKHSRGGGESILIKWLIAIQEAKDKAVSDEDFAKAKHLKNVIDLIKAKIQEMAAFDDQKRESIANEDFDKAKSIKQDIDNKRDAFIKELNRQGYSLGDDGKLVTNSETSVPVKPQEQQQNLNFDDMPIKPKQQAQDDLFADENPTEEMKKEEKSIGGSANELDDRPVKPRSQNLKFDEFDETSVPPGLEPLKENKKPVVPRKAKGTTKKKEKVFKPENDVIKNDLLETKPQNLSVEVFGQFSTPPFELDCPEADYEKNYPEAVRIFTNTIVDCALSKAFVKKEWALQTCQTQIGSAVESKIKINFKPEDIIKGSLQIVQICIGDSREKVSVLTLSLCSLILDYADLHKQHSLVEPVFPQLLAKPTDANPRVKQMLLEIICRLCNQQPLLIHMVFKNSTSNSSNPKLVKSRLEIAQHIIDQVDVKHSINEQMVLKWAASFWSNSSGEIRDLATAIVLSVYRRLLSKGMPVPEAKRMVLGVTNGVKPQIVSSLTGQLDQISVSPKKIETTKTVSKPKVGKTKPESPYIKPPSAKSTVKKSSSAQSTRKPATPAKPKPEKIDEQLENAVSNQWNIDKTCIFCEQKNSEFNEKTLDLHYWNDCPMLINCPQCSHIVEISALNEHFALECDFRERMKKCPRCLLHVNVNLWEAHVNAKSCPRMNKPQISNSFVEISPQTSMCPLCSQVLESNSELAWKKHLLIEKCPVSPRGKPKLEVQKDEGKNDIDKSLRNEHPEVEKEKKKKKFGLTSWFKK